MARSVAWRRTVSDNVSWRQDQALSATIYILRQTGPTGFLLKEEGETKNFKVFLGDPHKCTCPVFMKEKDLCKHICWVLLKKFKVPRQNAVTWQLGLVEREINEILRGAVVRQEARPSNAARKYAHFAAQMGKDPDSGKAILEQREIGADDVCPICQDELLAKHLPVTFCKFGCGNSVHIKCMKVWAEHQNSSGKSIIECPFCREDFGPISLLKQEMRNSSQRETRAERMNEHLGTTCRKCHVCPIVGKCYKCVTCADYHLCQGCFNTPTHTNHSFNFRQKPSQRWRPAPNRGQGGLLPDAVINNLMNREISEGDYDLLLQLDSQTGQQLSDLTEHTVHSFPMERVRQNGALMAPGQQCRICLRGYEVGQHVRRLPCRHKFHKDCIDDWLLHRHPTCPVDGTTFTNESVQQMNDANRTRVHQLRQASGQTQNVEEPQPGRVTHTGSHRNHNGVQPTENINLEIPGVGIPRVNGQLTGLSRRQRTGQQQNGVHGNDHRRVTDWRRHNSNSGGRYRGQPDHHDSDLSLLSVGDLVTNGVRQMHMPPSAEALDDMIIDMVTDDNRSNSGSAMTAELSGVIRNGSAHSQRSGVSLQSIDNDGASEALPHRSPVIRIPRESADFSDTDSREMTNQHITFDPERRPDRNNASQGLLNTDQPMDRLERALRRHPLPRRHSQPTSLPKYTPELNDAALQNINVNGSRFSASHTGSPSHQVMTGVSTGPSHHNHSRIESHATDGNIQPPSIPLPHNDSSILIDVGADRTGLPSGGIARKPPSGDHHHGNTCHGRLRHKPIHRGSHRGRSSSRERSQSLENDSRNTPNIQGTSSLFVGHDPSSLAGFNCEFLLSANRSRSSKSVSKNRALHGQQHNQSETGSNRVTEDISLSGTGLGTIDNDL